jgi:hypothetical protein
MNITEKITELFLNKYIQLIMAVIIIFLIIKYYIPLFFSELKLLENQNSVYKITDINYSVKIIDGIMPLISDEVFVTTSEKNDINYVLIPRSINRVGGAQFSFSFWLNKGANFNPSSLSNKTILLYGLKNKDTVIDKLPKETDDTLYKDIIKTNNLYKEILEPKNDIDNINYPGPLKGDKNYRVFNALVDDKIIVKCPLIRFGEDGKSIEIEINTVKKIENIYKIDAPVLDMLDADKWNMLTFIFEDYRNMFGISTGVKISFYIGAKQVASVLLENDTIKLNNGLIYILPNMGNNNGQENKGNIADVTYYNRALNLNEIKEQISKGVTESVYKTPRMKNKDLINKKYNDLTLYNETMQL